MDPVMRLLMGEEIEEEQRENLRLERLLLRDRSNPFHLPHREFKKLFRLPKNIAENLIYQLTPHMQEGQRNTKISIPLRILSILHFLATGNYQRNVGGNSNIAISQQTISKYLPEICNALQTIAPQWIRFPTSELEKQECKEGFMRKFGFPGVIGVIDGTQVAIDEPSEDEHIYFNRKGYHSKNVQLICDSELVLLNVNGNFGGAAHDSFIWTASGVRTIMETNYATGDRNSWLIGDSGYPLEPWLMTPIRTVEGVAEERYNNHLTSARNCVERCIGLLKTRFRCLLNKERILKYTPQKAGLIINACCVLHNICVKENVPLDDDVELANAGIAIPIPHENMPGNLLNIAREQRRMIINRYYQNYNE